MNIRLIALLILSIILFSCKNNTDFFEDFNNYNDRIWVNEKLWPIPLEDWQINDGRVECTGETGNMKLNLLTQLIEGDGKFSLSVEMGLINNFNTHGDAGLRLAVQDDTDNDIRSLCYFGRGIDIGVNTEGFLFLGPDKVDLPENFDFTRFTLMVDGSSMNGNNSLKVICEDDNNEAAEITKTDIKNLDGMIAFVQNFARRGNFKNGPKFFIDNISLSGSNVINHPENSFGPVLFAMYTLSEGNLKLTAQMPPLGENDNKTVAMQINKEGKWETIQEVEIEDKARIAPFSVKDWDANEQVDYRILYSETYIDGSETPFYFNGQIRKEPDSNNLSVGGLTCQFHTGFPYRPLTENLAKSNPDLLYFSGDQIYEANGGYGIVRSPADRAITNYLGKWYMFGWAFGDVMKDRPTVCIPDDHEVYQGNLWGAGGKTISQEKWASNPDCQSGFVQPIDMVNVVMRTNCSHLPDPYDPTPMDNDIKVYYTDIEYGGVDFALVGDRIFKSGPDEVSWWDGRKDHLKTPVKDVSKLDKPGLKFLGDRQMQFLDEWAKDWDGKQIKVLLSQTPFTYTTTHHGPNRMLLYGDLDSGGWPKSGRDNAIALMNKCKAFHITGDQHLTSMVQYGLDNYRDAGWIFCTPAISVGYPRRFFPDQLGWDIKNRPDHGNPNTGEFTDGFGNKNFVYAVGNPDDQDKHQNRYQQAELKASGYGMIYFNKEDREVTCESIRFLGDVDDIANAQFPGWPVTIDLDKSVVKK